MDAAIKATEYLGALLRSYRNAAQFGLISRNPEMAMERFGTYCAVAQLCLTLWPAPLCVNSVSSENPAASDYECLNSSEICLFELFDQKGAV